MDRQYFYWDIVDIEIDEFSCGSIFAHPVRSDNIGLRSQITIAAHKNIFSVEGLSETIMSVNRKEFVSVELANFCKRNKIKRVISSFITLHLMGRLSDCFWHL
ncbi:hypothetical protein RF11_09787 [Thelohanellus kitauei]|uniref:Uncharacterized protein n=1 Tax=Thelohanellus kitauei TaxID=669202 RepID=A0A0C2N602_THEKT|nr:hypothetical protein RF11_09787 [Thelohanellus kitauei]